MDRFGAFPEDWDKFDLVLGLTEDLLPCVSNPNKSIAKTSKLKAIGKVPSVYTRDGEVAGLANWTERRSTANQVNYWARESDYGICLQTRLVRALDIDVPDFAKSIRIAETIQRLYGAKLPTRSRANSGKFLVSFRLPGEFGKRKLEVDGGIIEFLGNGQQFVAAGTHPSGARYEFHWFDNADFPTLSTEQFEALWGGLVSEFGIAPPLAGGLRKPRSAVTNIGVSTDPVAAHLISSGAVIAEGSDGQLFITCPWKEEHTADSGETETAYFPAGTRGYQQGHFSCLHAHCVGRADEDFKSAFGCGVADDFECLPDVGERSAGSAGLVERKDLPAFSRKKSGAIEATINNLTRAVGRPDVCQWVIGFDEFRDEIMYFPNSEPQQWRQLNDADYVRLREYLESNGFDPLGRELIRDAVLRVADDNRFDSAQAWLNALTWDGKQRVESFLTVYFGAPSNAYTVGVSRYIWTALAGRILHPAIKADMVPILINGQGNLKSTAVSALSPDPQFFVTMKLDDRDDNLSRLMRGRLVVELPELSGLHTRELEAIKAFITRTHESWIPKFREFATTFPRRCLFFGTTNKQELFVDETGNRRWLPVEAKRAKLDELIADRDQLWAEGREMFLADGVMWQEAERLAPAVHEQHMMTDAWQEVIQAWMDLPDDVRDTECPAARGEVTIPEIMRNALNLEMRFINKSAEMRVAAIMRKLGWERATKRLGTNTKKVWRKLPPVTTLLPLA